MTVPVAELDPAAKAIYRKHIHDRTHFAGYDFDLLDLDEKPVKQIPAGAGTIAVTDEDPISRGFSGDIPDPHRLIDVDGDAPGEGSVYPTRMLRILTLIYVPDLGEQISDVAFLGPLSKYKRDGANITVEAQGKEAFWFYGCGPLHIKEGAEVTSAIRQILRHIGETKMRIQEPPIPCHVMNPILVGPDEEIRPGKVLKKLSGAVGMQLFAANDGYITLRNPVKRPVTTFDHVHSTPAVEFDASELVNDVRVTGAKGVFGSAHLPASHPFGRDNPEMKRGGQPGWRVKAIRNDQIGSDAQADRVAQNELLESSRQVESVTVDLPPDYGLNARDPIAIRAPSWTKTFPVRTLNIPIGPGLMNFGIDLKTAKPKKRRR